MLAGGRYERRTLSGHYIEFSYKRLDDGGLLGVYRDITELKNREEALASAKEAAEAARDTAERARAEATEARNDAERTRAMMQTVLDNMNDAVMLFDKDMRWQFVNRQLMDFQRFTPDRRGTGRFGLLHSRISGPARRLRRDSGIPDRCGGPAARRRRCARARATSAAPRAANTSSSPSSRWTTAACSRSTATSRELKNREEALATAKEAAERARDDVERTREVMQTVLDNMSDGVTLVGQGLPLAVLQPLQQRHVGLQGSADARNVGLRHYPCACRARRVRPDRRHRGDGHAGGAANPAARAARATKRRSRRASISSSISGP